MKFKLIKNYPLCPFELGTIATDDNVKSDVMLCIRTDIGRYTTYPKEAIVGNPEFWEEVKEKEYTILSFVSKDGTIFEHKIAGRYASKLLMNPVITEEIGLKSYSIHSVRREKDGIVFQLRDKIVSTSKDFKELSITIEKIEINKVALGGIYLLEKVEGIALNCAEKAPVRKPILITEDGVEIFEGDCFHSVHKDSFNSLRCNYTLENKGKWLIFSTKEKAEEYIKWNKPMYSLNDVKGEGTGTAWDIVVEKLIKLDRK